MIHVGGRLGRLGAFKGSPTSSSTMTSTYSQLAADADGLPSVKRSMMKLAVLPYHAWPV
jgi:hypothetical protein